MLKKIYMKVFRVFYGLAKKRQVYELAEIVCRVMGGNKKLSIALLVETCAAETLLGSARDQTLYSSGAGVAQVDQETFEWLQKKYGNSVISKRFFDQLNIRLEKIKYNELDFSPLLSLIFCRLRYWTVAEPIPKTRGERAQYWKRHYNTTAGKGHAADYLTRCHSVIDVMESF